MRTSKRWYAMLAITKLLMKQWSRAGALHWFPLVWVDMVYLWYFFRGNGGGDMARMLPFTVLVVLHSDLYIFAFNSWLKNRWYAPSYLALQGMLLLILSIVAQNWLVTLGLYLAYVVKTVELLERTRPLSGLATSVAMLIVLSLNLEALQMISGVHEMSWLYVMLPLLCIGGYIALCVRQAYGYQRTQRLLHELRTAHSELSATHGELAAAHAQLAAYAVEVEELSTMQERQRIARELHDTLTQGLAGLILQLEAVEARLADNQTGRAREIVGQALERTRATFASARHVIHDLRTEASDGATNLYAAAQEEIEHFSKATAIACTTDIELLRVVPVEQREHVLGLLKEALTNVARHARAQHVTVRAWNEGTWIYIEVCDDGRGFQPERVVAGHYGLLGLKERAQLIGGQLTIASVPGSGTSIQLSLPLLLADTGPRPVGVAPQNAHCNEAVHEACVS
ncbi:MAG: sensor histidine kinase [Ktedonobacteraceae bacterium]|nr:sensor histidine kinase [Ktedonobacteraceae bacterium]